MQEEFSFDNIKSEFKSHTETIKKMLRWLLLPHNRDMLEISHDERLLFASNIDLLWRCVLFAQEKVISSYDVSLNQKLNALENEHIELENSLQLDIDAKAKQINELKHKIIEQEKSFEKRLENISKEKERMQIVAQERLFDLQAVKNDADNSSITGIFIHTFNYNIF